MSLSDEQIKKLVGQVANAKEDYLDCDGCFDRIAEFAEAQLADRNLCDAMRAVQNHLESCGCCNDEYQALLEGLKAIKEDSE